MTPAHAWRAALELPTSSFDAAALATLLGVIGDPSPLIRRGLPMIAPPAWHTGALSELFGLDVPTHCFHAAPHDWVKFHEPQITAGFAHFLNSGDGRRRLARAVALVKAAALCAGRVEAELDAYDARAARCVAEENRTDILVELDCGSRQTGASIEAKFGHQLTNDQLPKARRHVHVARKWDMDSAILLVVAPDLTQLNGAIFRRNEVQGWRATSWWALLSEYERLFDPAQDCDDFRRFRRTVWRRAH